MTIGDMAWAISLSDEDFKTFRDETLAFWDKQVAELKVIGKFDEVLQMIDQEHRSRMAHVEGLRIPFPI